MSNALARYQLAEQAYLAAFTNDQLPLEDKRVVCRYALLNLNYAHANLLHAKRQVRRFGVIQGGLAS